MRRPAIIAILALVAGFFLLGSPAADAASYSPSSYATRLLSLVNQAREQQGLRPLTATSGTGTVAASWTNHMAANHTLAHNPDLAHDLSTHGSSHWMTYGENVGQGYATNPDGLFKAYMNSPEHRDNILTGAYRYVGVGVTFSGRVAWNTFDFVDAYGSSPKPVAKPVSPPVQHHTTVHHAAAPQPKPQPAAAPTPVVHHAAPVAHHASAKPAARDRVHVKGVQTRSPAPRPLPDFGVATTPVALPIQVPAQSGAPKAIAVAFAALALAAASRRWVFAIS
jgi:hypothetical protein